MSIFELEHIRKRFGATIALDGVSMCATGPSIIGLIGRNGSGKSTLLRHIVGLYLPDRGTCHTFGTPSHDLGPAELSRIGAVHQRDPLLGWMTVEQHVRYVSTFYPRWDRSLEGTLLRMFELQPNIRVRTLSPGTLQRLALVLAVCHRPQLLLLDEPLSDLDPISREEVLRALLDRFGDEAMTIVISSHMLRDIEKVVDRIVCLDRGTVVSDSPLDQLQEMFAEWVVRSPDGGLPQEFPESYVLQSETSPHEARLLVRDPVQHVDAFTSTYGADLEQKPLNLERIFPLLLRSPAGFTAAALERDPEAGAVTWKVR